MTIMTHAVEQPRRAHPDEVANRIATKFVGELVNKYGCMRADVDSTIGDAHVNVAGNVKYNGWDEEVDYDEILRMTALDVLKSAGYNDEWLGFNLDSMNSTTDIRPQSEEITEAQHEGYRYGDSRSKWGYYTRNTESGLPVSTELIDNVIYHVDNAFMENELPIGPDGKAQLMMDGDKISKITLAVQEDPASSHDEIVGLVKKYLYDMLGDSLYSDAKVNVNTSGSFVHGGPACDKGQSNTKSGVYAQSFPSLGGGPYGKDISKAEVVLPIQAHLIARGLLDEYSDSDVCVVLLDASIGTDLPDIQVYFGDNASPDKYAAIFVKNNLGGFLEPHKVIEDYLTKPGAYDSIAEHGLLGGVFGGKYRPPFRI